MSREGYVVFDLGAESGRAMLASFDGQTIALQEVHRFANLPRQLPSGYHWDLLGLWGHLLEGLAGASRVAREQNLELVSLGVDTWGVDFALLGKSGQLLGLPYAYRDPRHEPAMQWALEQVGAEAIYEATGIQLMSLNSLYQLIAQQRAEPGTLEQADRLLTMPDLLHYFFTGERANELTIASTTQMLDAHSGRWHAKLLERLGLPTHMLGDIVPAGATLGPVLASVTETTGAPRLDVVLPGSHDTASAVAAVPVTADAGGPGERWAYLSSGTWSLLGAELNEPLVNEAARQANFTNERGIDGRIRFLKNIAGLWLVQQVRRDFERRGASYDYAELTRLAAEALPFRTLIDPDHGPFALPGDMCAKVDAYARGTNQPAPQTPGQYVRCCLESLALTYRRTLDTLERLLGHRLDVLHIVGGGGKNQLLNQMTADAIGRPTVVGPFEATAIGNALTQAMGRGSIANLAELRAVVARSYELERYEPGAAAGFDEKLARYESLLDAAVSDAGVL